jgi:hypothetical protein
MKTLTIGTKRQATRMSTETLFHPVNGHTITKTQRYCSGKYASNLRGHQLEVPDDVFALWTERRKDKDGPYWSIFCLTA